MTNPIDANLPPYMLGTGQEEQRRLIAQADALDTLTRQLLTNAGIAPGMRVLDVGTGAGDLALIVRELVGCDGQVLGIDRDPDNVALARQRAADLSLANVDFAVADLVRFGSKRSFDAVVGRLVLVHQPDLEAAIAACAALLNPGGILAFLEAHFDPQCSSRFWPGEPNDAVDEFYGLIHQLLIGLELTTVIGPKLVSAMTPFGTVHAEARAELVMLQPDSAELLLDIAFLNSLLPRARAVGLVSPGQINVEAMAQTVRAALAQRPRARISGILDVMAWTKVHNSTPISPAARP